MGRRDGSVDWAAKLWEYRTERGATQRACAEAVGADVNAWALWERGEREPSPGWRWRLNWLLAVPGLPSPGTTLGAVLRDYRGRLALTQAEAARRLGVAERTYRRWETGYGVPGEHNEGRVWRIVDRELRELYG
jgi:transcriptional regulator with XRE-family HTH domain